MASPSDSASPANWYLAAFAGAPLKTDYFIDHNTLSEVSRLCLRKPASRATRPSAFDPTRGGRVEAAGSPDEL